MNADAVFVDVGSSVASSVTLAIADGLAQEDNAAVGVAAALDMPLGEADTIGVVVGETDVVNDGVGVALLVGVPLGVPDTVLDGDAVGVTDGLTPGDSVDVGVASALGVPLRDGDTVDDGVGMPLLVGALLDVCSRVSAALSDGLLELRGEELAADRVDVTLLVDVCDALPESVARTEALSAAVADELADADDDSHAETPADTLLEVEGEEASDALPLALAEGELDKVVDAQALMDGGVDVLEVSENAGLEVSDAEPPPDALAKVLSDGLLEP